MWQVTFENPRLLWFLLTLPLLVIAHYYFLRHAKKKALRFANFKALKRVTGKNLITKNYTILALRLIVFFCAILAVSGTVVWYDGLASENDYVLAIDTSASMTSQDVAPTRLEAAQEDALRFVDALNARARIGVVTFAGTVFIRETPTEERAKVRAALDELEPMKAGGTDLAAAIITSTNLLLDNKRGRAVVLITDGSNTVETFLDESLRRALDYAAERRVKVHTIGIGSDSGPIGYLPKYYNVSGTYNEETLLAIANATGGWYAHAGNSEELFSAFEKITGESKNQLLRRDLSPWLMLLALACLFVEWVLINTRFRTLP